MHSFYRSLISELLDVTIKVHSYFVRSARRKETAALTVAERQDVDRLLFIDEKYLANELNHLRSLLRKFPFWVGGHIQCGERALEKRAFDLAYASAQAVERLKPGLFEGVLLLGKCHLRARSFAEAEKILEPLARKHPSSVVAKEYYGAALLALNKNKLAAELYRSIPEHQRTIEMQGILHYLASPEEKLLEKASTNNY